MRSRAASDLDLVSGREWMEAFAKPLQVLRPAPLAQVSSQGDIGVAVTLQGGVSSEDSLRAPIALVEAVTMVYLLVVARFETAGMYRSSVLAPVTANQLLPARQETRTLGVKATQPRHFAMTMRLAHLKSWAGPLIMQASLAQNRTIHLGGERPKLKRAWGS